MEEKKSTKKCVQKESKSNNVQRATFSLSGAAAISKSSKHWPQLKVTVTVAVAPCRGVGSRRLSVVGVLVAAVLTLLLFYFVG